MLTFQTFSVLDSYPLGFLQEAAAKIGATFYQTIRSKKDIDKSAELLIDPRKLNAQIQSEDVSDAFKRYLGPNLGTMLPFQTQGLAMSWVTHNMPKMFRTDVVDHPSVAGWHICGDGSVRIREAGVYLSSQSGKKLGTIAGHIYPQELVLSLRPRLKVFNSDNVCDIDIALKILAGEGQVYAVTLYTEQIMNSGIIIWGPRQNPSTTQVFVKIGVYESGAPDDVLPTMTETTNVDWIIL